MTEFRIVRRVGGFRSGRTAEVRAVYGVFTSRGKGRVLVAGVPSRAAARRVASGERLPKSSDEPRLSIRDPPPPRARPALDRPRVGSTAQAPPAPTNSDGDERAARATDDRRSYRLRRTEGAAEGIQRVIIGRLDDAVEQLRERVADDAVTAVHEARKDLKKARSAIRLARGGIGRKRYRKANRGLRDAGRALSGTRDADVRSETLRRLRDAFSDELSAAAAAAIDAAIEEAERAAGAGAGGADPSEVAARAAAEIERVRAAVARWELSIDGWKLVGPGLERGYRGGRLEFRRVLDGPTPEAIHSGASAPRTSGITYGSSGAVGPRCWRRRSPRCTSSPTCSAITTTCERSAIIFDPVRSARRTPIGTPRSWS